MKTVIRECAIDAAADDTEQIKITVGKIETELNWWPWKEIFQCRLENKKGALKDPILHVIREDKPAGWTIAQATNEVKGSSISCHTQDLSLRWITAQYGPSSRIQNDTIESPA